MDIYLNGGKTQPDCPGWIVELGCSHLFPLWFLPKIWERAANGDTCRATIKCPDMTHDKVRNSHLKEGLRFLKRTRESINDVFLNLKVACAIVDYV